VKFRNRHVLLGLGLALIVAGPAIGQSALTDDILLATDPPGAVAEYSPHPVCDGTGVCGLFWNGFHRSSNVDIDIFAAVTSSDGQLLVQPRLLTTGNFNSGPIAVGMKQGFAVLWDQEFPDGHIGPILQYYDESLVPRGEKIALPFAGGLPRLHDPKSYTALLDLIPTGSGFVLYAFVIDNPASAFNIYTFFIDRNGNQTQPRQRLNSYIPAQPINTGPGALAVQPNGDLLGVYSQGNNDIFVRKADAEGRPLGSEQRVNIDRHADQGQAVMAVAPDGSFLVVWQAAPAPDTTSDILARRFSAQGQPLGKPFRVNNVHQLAQRNPAITVDAKGNYFIVWQSFIPPYNWDVKGRLFRSNGTPVADEVRLNQVRQLEQDIPHVTFSPSGTILVGWESGSLRQRGNEEFVPVARVFSGAPQ
jgi:hypothetical protein